MIPLAVLLFLVHGLDVIPYLPWIDFSFHNIESPYFSMSDT